MESVSETDYLLTLIRTALNEFDQVELAASARRALRVAQLRGDSVDAWMFRMDLRPMGGSAFVRQKELQALFRNVEPSTGNALNARLLEEWIAERNPARVPELLQDQISPDSVIAGSIDDIERRVHDFGTEADASADPTHRLKLNLSADLSYEVLGRIRHRTFAYLCGCETAMLLGAVTANVFARHRSRVDRYLSSLAPEVVEQLNAAYRRSTEGDRESLTHALTSCRRILRSVADVVYPPRRQPVVDAQGKFRVVGPEQYCNRLWQFLLAETSGHQTAARLFHANLEDVGTRLDRLYELASKGVHDEVTQEEVDLCVIQTYLLTGEVLARWEAQDGSTSSETAVSQPSDST